MSDLRFSKWQAAGNDFLIVDDRSSTSARSRRDRPRAVRSVGRRGCGRPDPGLRDRRGRALPVRADERGRIARRAVGQRRPLPRRLLCQRAAVPQDAFEIETVTGVRSVTVASDGAAPPMPRSDGHAELHQGGDPDARAGVGDVPRAAVRPGGGLAVTASALSIGNPHLVLFVEEDPERYHVEHLGPALEHHELVPGAGQRRVRARRGRGRDRRPRLGARRRGDPLVWDRGVRGRGGGARGGARGLARHGAVPGRVADGGTPRRRRGPPRRSGRARLRRRRRSRRPRVNRYARGMVHLSPAIRDVEPYPFEELDRRKKAALDAGRTLIDFGVGDPARGDRPRSSATRSTSALAPISSYPRAAGLARAARGDRGVGRPPVRRRPRRRRATSSRRSARRSWSSRSRRRWSTRRRARTWSVTTAPGYPIPERGARLRGRSRCSGCRSPRPTAFLPRPRRLRHADVWRRAAVLWLNYPNNPTGAVAPLDFLRRCRRPLPRARRPARLGRGLQRALVRGRASAERAAGRRPLERRRRSTPCRSARR